jgi:fatty-acid desaturase
VDGRIVWAPAKSILFTAHAIAGIAGVLLLPSWQALAVFVLLTAITICAGHSVGIHRLLIHRSFATSRFS